MKGIFSPCRSEWFGKIHFIENYFRVAESQRRSNAFWRTGFFIPASGMDWIRFAKIQFFQHRLSGNREGSGAKWIDEKAGLFKRLPKDANKRVHEALAAVGMEQFQHRNIGELSGGQQQRVFIARALISEPKLLVLDEPTVGVDIKQVQSFYDMLGELNKKHNLTIILVTHDIETPSNQISHVAFLNKRILFTETWKNTIKFQKNKFMSGTVIPYGRCKESGYVRCNHSL